MGKIHFRTPKNECSTCHWKLDCATSVGKTNTGPSINALSVCVNCGTLSKFDANLTLIPLDPDELKEISQKWPEQYLLLTAAQRMIKARAKQN